MNSIKEFLSYIIKFTGYKFFLVILLTSFLIIFQLLMIFSIVPLIDLTVKPDSLSNVSNFVKKFLDFFNAELNLLSAGLIFLFLSLLAAIFKILISYYILKIKYEFLANIISENISNFLSAGLNFYHQMEAGKVINTFQAELSKIGNSFNSLANVIVSFLQVFFILLLPITLFPKVTTLFIICGIMIFSPIFFYKKKIENLGKFYTESGNKFAKSVFEIVSLLTLIVSFGNKSKTLHNTKENFVIHSNVAVKYLTLNEFISTIVFPLTILAVIISVIFMTDNLTRVSELGLVIFAFQRTIQPIATILNGRFSLGVYSSALNQMESLSLKSLEFKQKSGEKEFKKLNQSIICKNLKFIHKNRETLFNDVSFELKKKKFTTIIGESGSGKTTLINLLLGLYQNYSGLIIYDKDNLKDLNLISLRKKIGYVPQESNFFNSSIKENLLWSNPKATDEDFFDILKMVKLDNLVKSLPENLYTNIGQMGNNISGGQKQRLSLARALIKKPEILVLDEPTSSLDEQSENIIKETLIKLKDRVTIILISHKKNMIEIADSIYEIKNKRIHKIK